MQYTCMAIDKRSSLVMLKITAKRKRNTSTDKRAKFEFHFPFLHVSIAVAACLSFFDSIQRVFRNVHVLCVLLYVFFVLDSLCEFFFCIAVTTVGLRYRHCLCPFRSYICTQTHVENDVHMHYISSLENV